VEAAVFADEVDLRHVGMPQARLRTGLAFESVDDLGIVRDVDGQNLDGDGALQR